VTAGVKTRIAIKHTCGNPSPRQPVVKHRETSKEEIYLYIERLKAFWNEEKQEWR